MKMTEAQMDHIWKNNLYGTLNSDHKKQFDVCVWDFDEFFNHVINSCCNVCI